MVQLSFTRDGRMLGKVPVSPATPHGLEYVEVTDPVVSKRLTLMANSRRLHQYLNSTTMLLGGRPMHCLSFHKFQPDVEAQLMWKTTKPIIPVRGYRLQRLSSTGGTVQSAREMYNTMRYADQQAQVREIYIPYHVCRRGIWLIERERSVLAGYEPALFRAINEYGQLL